MHVATDVRLTASRCAVSALFFVNGAILASWVPYVPMVKERLGIGDGQLGIILLFAAIGALGALPFAGALVSRSGSRAVSVAAGLGLCVTLPLPVLMPTPFLVALGLLVLGAFNSTLDVAMNAQAVEVEQRRGYALMSSFHAMFSVGGLAGALLSSVVVAAGVGAADHVLAAALLGSVTILLARSALIAVAPSPSPVFVRPTRGLLGLGVLALCALLAEGAIGDWSAVYLMDSRGASQSVAAAGFAAFSLTMAGGRFAGDHVARWLGAACLLRLSGALAAGGLLLALIVREPVIAIAGFGLVGLGVANLIPVIFSAAGRAYAIPPGHGLAAVATTGYVGFLAGPPVIGLAAEVAGLPAALGIVAIACAAVAIAAHLAGDRIPTRTSAGPSPRKTIFRV